MKEFKSVAPEELSINPFTTIGKDWMLIAAEKDGRVNAMTASWGGLGVIWAKNVAYIFIRRSRFTKEFIDSGDSFSLTIYDTEKYRSMLTYMGRVSGRDEDKVAKAGLTVAHKDGIPYFEEAKLVLLCKKLSCHFLNPEGLLTETAAKHYGDCDYHEMYVGEIVEVLSE